MIRDFFAESLVFSLVFLVRVDPTKYRPLISGLHLLAAAIQQITAMKDFFSYWRLDLCYKGGCL